MHLGRQLIGERACAVERTRSSHVFERQRAVGDRRHSKGAHATLDLVRSGLERLGVAVGDGGVNRCQLRVGMLEHQCGEFGNEFLVSEFSHKRVGRELGHARCRCRRRAGDMASDEGRITHRCPCIPPGARTPAHGECVGPAHPLRSRQYHDRMDDATLTHLADRLRTSRRVTVLTGAGVSAISGVPTFRGQGGLWNGRRPEELATPEAFSADPAGVWAWYAWRRELIARCEPNPAHHVLAGWTQQHDGWQVLTQNVDDLHVRAGTTRLVRLHGSIWDLRCAGTCVEPGWRDEELSATLRRCPVCGGPARPAVVWFGEALGRDDVAAALAATACDVFLTVGTSSVVHPAAGLVHEAARRGAFTVEINTDQTPASGVVSLAIQGPCEVVLPELDARLRTA